ncbi:hypothetical protein [Radiobacillus deserti]|uniref:Uncharacterized protein n=1 Tax=Radiobacillus deserti TaxID=2594883 RepID=A0A516KFU1_9BACI|nr:hypothetical protein [Radiobacillus deserti]QDP40264.1 hypothetical protein FN924_08805 [Radiobacillus deserti]
MKTKINIGSFIASLVCIGLFFIATASSEIVHFFRTTIGFHPLNIVLTASLLTVLFGVLGFSGMNSWKALLRSIVTLCLSLGLSLLTIFILVIGSLLT